MKLSKTERVLRYLQYFGDDGVFSFDLQPIGGFRYSARVKDLKNKGYNIVSVKEKRGNVTGCRYFYLG